MILGTLAESCQIVRAQTVACSWTTIATLKPASGVTESIDVTPPVGAASCRTSKP